jgi:aryl-alcohol dehydrogenase-like predicted oxidoreductase
VRATRLGATKLHVTAIGFGLAAIGRPAYINLGRDEDLGRSRSVEAMRDRAHDLLDHAWAAGIRYFDAARSYGQAEAFLASWLERRGIEPGQVTVGSKWGYEYTAGWRVGAAVNEVKDLSLGMLRRQAGESRALLGRWLGLYQIHSATLESGVLADPTVLAELVRLRAEGLVIGLSVSGPRQADTIRAALATRIAGVNPFEAVQATWNLLEPSAGPALAEAAAAGWGVLVKEALANGRLTERGEVAVVERLRRVAVRHGTRPDAVALAAALAQPGVDVALSGAVTPEQLRSNVASLEVRLTDEDLAELADLAMPADEYWAERSGLAWS